jgi:large subunit ribosomal protein L6
VSRIGKKPVQLEGVTVSQTGNIIKIKGKLGELQREFHPNMKIEVGKEEIVVTRPDDTKVNKALHGLTRAVLQNMVNGVKSGYEKTLDIVGVGYKAEQKGKNVLFTIGLSHPVYFAPPESVKVEVATPTQVKISGIDKELVGLVAAKIRSLKKPEPYKGKGIRYSDEVIIKKAGKTAGK